VRARRVALGAAGLAACSSAADDQREVLEVALDDARVTCLWSRLHGRVSYDVSAIVPEGFADLARGPAVADVRLEGGALGSRRLIDDEDCALVYVPRISGDRALVVVGFGRAEPGFRGIGLRRSVGNWTVVARRSTGPSHQPGEEFNVQ
jgi:hypothetical protein